MPSDEIVLNGTGVSLFANYHTKLGEVVDGPAADQQHRHYSLSVAVTGVAIVQSGAMGADDSPDTDRPIGRFKLNAYQTKLELPSGEVLTEFFVQNATASTWTNASFEVRRLAL